MNMKTLKDIIARITEIAGDTDVWLVGGTVRDILLARPLKDIDIAVSVDSRALAVGIADALGGSFFPLDDQRGTYRVVVAGGLGIQVDLTRLQGETIEEDLAHRDFTINAMAVNIREFYEGMSIETPGEVRGVIDLFGGRSDIDNQRLRALDEASLVDDPLRLLRAFRIAGQLGFTVEESTLSLINAHASLIDIVSVERVREELYYILRLDNASDIIGRIWDAGLLEMIMPEVEPMTGMPQSAPHIYGLMGHSLKTVEHSEAIMSSLDHYFGSAAVNIKEYLEETVDGTLEASGLVKLCALLHDIGKPRVFSLEGDRVRFLGHEQPGAEMCHNIASRLKMSAKAASTLTNTAGHHMRPLMLSRTEPTRRAMYRFIRDVGDDLPALLILALADAYATDDRPEARHTEVERVVRQLAGYYYGEYRAQRAEPLVGGRDLIEVLGLTPGPMFSELLADIEDKWAAGEVSDRAEALEYLRGRVA